MRSKPVEYLPAAWLEFEASAAWYEEHESGVGERFRNVVASTELKVQRNPRFGTPYRRNTRKWRVPHFPFSLIYREEPRRIVIVAVAHGKRRESYWEWRVD